MLLLSLYKTRKTNKQTRKTREEIKLGKPFQTAAACFLSIFLLLTFVLFNFFAAL
jgi:hypothetical protein